MLHHHLPPGDKGFSRHREKRYADVAHSVEQPIRNRQVVGSSPTVSSTSPHRTENVAHSAKHNFEDSPLGRQPVPRLILGSFLECVGQTAIKITALTGCGREAKAVAANNVLLCTCTLSWQSFGFVIRWSRVRLPPGAPYGCVAEWFKATVLNTVDRKVRGFKSHRNRHFAHRRESFERLTPGLPIQSPQMPREFFGCRGWCRKCARIFRPRKQAGIVWCGANGCQTPIADGQKSACRPIGNCLHAAGDGNGGSAG